MPKFEQVNLEFGAWNLVFFRSFGLKFVPLQSFFKLTLF